LRIKLSERLIFLFRTCFEKYGTKNPLRNAKVERGNSMSLKNTIFFSAQTAILRAGAIIIPSKTKSAED